MKFFGVVWLLGALSLPVGKLLGVQSIGATRREIRPMLRVGVIDAPK